MICLSRSCQDYLYLTLTLPPALYQPIVIAGEFAVQTCFQGRFGEQLGSDQFGAQVMLHAPRPDEDLVVGRIEHVEFTYSGQAFRLGRYAIHFHLNGRMHGSYVRGCSVHRSFNRAVNVHGTHNLLVEHNVLYDIMGGAFFLEDGIETGNTFQYNLAVFVISSTSLQVGGVVLCECTRVVFIYLSHSCLSDIDKFCWLQQSVLYCLYISIIAFCNTACSSQTYSVGKSLTLTPWCLLCLVLSSGSYYLVSSAISYLCLLYSAANVYI